MTDSRVLLHTPRLELRLQTPAEALAWVDTLPAADRAEVSPAWIARVAATAPGDVWRLGFDIHLASTGALVGSCAFKGPPDPLGVVEIAYGIAESARGRGFATEAAGALVAYAMAQPAVRVVRAHTRHENGASGAVLRKCGFIARGEVTDPEDGVVMRWERPAV